MTRVCRVTEALRTHLEGQGYVFDLDGRGLDEKLRRLLGRDRWAAHRAAVTRYEEGWAGIADVYQSVRTVEEANLLMSRQGGVVLAVNAHVADQCLRQAPKRANILDAGCWTGGLATFLAAQRPDLRVVGADRLGPLVAAATARRTSPSLSFVSWDYGVGPLPWCGEFDVIVCALGIDFDLRLARYFPVDGSAARDCQGYAVSHAEVLGYYRNLRAVAKPGARLITVLRSPCFAHALAVVDAATDGGWALRLAESGWVEVRGERFPAFAFRAALTRRVEEGRLLGWWVRGREGDEDGDSALWRFRRLKGKEVVRVWERGYADGHAVRREVGLAEGTGYLYTAASMPFHRLQLVPASEVRTVPLEV